MNLFNYLTEKLDNKYLTLSVILLIAFILRVYNLNFEDLWTDEMISLYASNPFISLRRMYDVLHFWDQTPPLYPVLFRLWLKIAGFTEFNARFFSVIGGMLSLIAVYFLIKEIYNRSSALLVTFLLSITPYHIYFSREARSYIWALFITTLVLYFFIKQLKSYDKKINRVLFIITGGLLLHVSYFSFFIHAGLVCILLIVFLSKKYPLNLKDWFIDYILIGIMFLPWLFQFIRILGFHNGDNGSSPHWYYFLQMINVFSGSVTSGYVLIVTFLLLFVAFCFNTYFKKQSFDKAFFFYAFILLFFFVYILMYLKSATGRNILNGFMYSYVIVLLPVYCIVLGGIIYMLNKKTIVLFTFIFLTVNVYNFDSWYKLGYHKKVSEPLRSIALLISSSAQPKAPIVCSGAHTQEFYFYKLNMAEQLIELKFFENKYLQEKMHYLWVIDSYDLKSEMILEQVKRKIPVTVKEINYIRAKTGNIVFRAILLELKTV